MTSDFPFENQKKTCLNCGFVTENNYAYFCQECGTPIVNKCTDENCNCQGFNEERILTQNAKYCSYCGAESLFKKQGLFDK